MRNNNMQNMIHICLMFGLCMPPPPPLYLCFRVLTFSEHRAPNEPGQFCSLFVLGGAMKYSGLVLPWDQAGGCGFVSTPRPALPSTVHPAPSTIVLRGWTRESPLPPNIMSHFLLVFTEGCFPALLDENSLFRHAIPPTSLLDSGIYVWLFPAGKGVGYSSMWTLSIHDQWRGPALYTKLSRRAGLFYSQPCGFKQIAQTGELKQILSYRSKTCRENR